MLLRTSGAARLGVYLALYAATYYLAVQLGLGFRFQSSQISVVWPANSLLLAALILMPKRRWWLVILATAFAHAAAMGSSIPMWRVLWQVAGNVAFVVTTVEILRRVVRPPLHFNSRRQVFVYTALAFVMPALFGVITPSFVRSLLHLETIQTPMVALLRTTLSNSTAMLLVVPIVLLWGRYGLRRLGELSARHIAEAAAIIVSVLAVGLVAFSASPDVARRPWLLIGVFPPVLWAAVRFGPVGASTALFSIAALSVWGTAREMGPFVLTANVDRVLSLQLFWLVLCPPVMLLAAVVREREQIEKALHAQRNQLAHVTRVATAGEMSGAIAHELRQPLMAILANAQAARQLLTREVPDVVLLQTILSDIVDQNKQAANVIDRLRVFITEGESHFETLAIEALLRDALALGRSAITIAGVDVQTQIAGGLPRVHGDPVQLLQVLLNLIMNGCESMSALPSQERHLRLQAATTGTAHVEILVADCGVGLPAGSEDRVFEPFFTTKQKGLGLGLAISRSIATAHGGRLWGERNPLGGATFHLLLPADGVQGAAAHRHR